MCGICGFITPVSENASQQRDVLKSMCDSIMHRGPDEEGFYTDKRVALGIRRLKIIDLETGSQPIHNEDGSVWVVLNGEIYNFPELKRSLQDKGHVFYTRSDTEVIVHLYEVYGKDFIKYLNGMFAFALWDKNKQTLILARDRLGKKPLHYLVQDNTLVFASEIKAILEYPGISRQIDHLSLAKYLAYEYVPAPHSIFQGIKKIMPASYLCVQDGRLEHGCYWELDFSRKFTGKQEDMALELKRLLGDSVKRRLISDVPLGVFLSGGIDSSIVTALMAGYMSRPVKTFSIGFTDRSFDEVKYARYVSRIFNTDHHEHILAPQQMLELIPRIAQFLDEPLADASLVPTYLLSALTRQDITVALGGDGGDELFAGYPTYLAHRFAKSYQNIPKLVRKYCIENIIEHLPTSFDNFSLDFKAKKFISGMDQPFILRHFIWLGSFSVPELKQLLHPEIANGIALEEVYDDPLQRMDGFTSADYMDQAMFLDLQFYLQDDILVKTDRASMACSLEVRSPFLDHNVVEFAASLPAKQRLNGFTSKYILKKVFKDDLPKEILNRKKKGFGIPVAKWLLDELKPLVLEMLSCEQIKRQGIFNPAYIQDLLAQHFNKLRDNRKKIWTLLIFQLWHKHYLKGY